MARRPLLISTWRPSLVLARVGGVEPVEGVVEVEADLAEASAAGDRREVAGEAAVAVVHVALRVAGALAVRLEHADGHGDLELANRRQVVPLFLGAHAGDVAAVRREEVLA
jgi:hypothetical protein